MTFELQFTMTFFRLVIQHLFAGFTRLSTLLFHIKRIPEKRTEGKNAWKGRKENALRIFSKEDGVFFSNIGKLILLWTSKSKIELVYVSRIYNSSYDAMMDSYKSDLILDCFDAQVYMHDSNYTWGEMLEMPIENANIQNCKRFKNLNRKCCDRNNIWSWVWKSEPCTKNQ